MPETYFGKHFLWYESQNWVHCELCIQNRPEITNFSFKGTKYCHVLRQIGFQDPKIQISYPQNAFSGPSEHIIHCLDHENGCIIDFLK